MRAVRLWPPSLAHQPRWWQARTARAPRGLSAGRSRDDRAAGGVEDQVEAEHGVRDRVVDPEALLGDGVDDEEVPVHLVSGGRRRAHEPAYAAVVDEHEGVAGEARALGAGAGVERGHVGGQVDERPVPEAVRGGGVGVVAGDRVALRALRRAAPRQLRRGVAELRDLVVLERLAVGDVVAGDGERGDLRQEARTGWASRDDRDSSALLTRGRGGTNPQPTLRIVEEGALRPSRAASPSTGRPRARHRTPDHGTHGRPPAVPLGPTARRSPGGGGRRWPGGAAPDPGPARGRGRRRGRLTPRDARRSRDRSWPERSAGSSVGSPTRTSPTPGTSSPPPTTRRSTSR